MVMAEPYRNVIRKVFAVELFILFLFLLLISFFLYFVFICLRYLHASLCMRASVCVNEILITLSLPP